MRQEYLQMRRTGQHNLDWFYRYYLENKQSDKDTLPFELFVQTFRMFYQINAPSIVEYLDYKFEVQKIQDQNNNIIYIN